MNKTTWKAILVVSGCLLHAGCSLVFTSAPPSRSFAIPGECTSDYAVPMIDLMQATSAAAGAALAFNEDVEINGSEQTAQLVFGAATVAYAGSAIMGFRRVERCREALRRSWQRLQDRSAEQLRAELSGPTGDGGKRD